MSTASFGHGRERAIKKLTEDEGWVVLRSPASKGEFDLVMLKAGERSRVVECKATAAGPYSGFGPADRSALLAIARRAGAEAWLAWWPKRKTLKWIPAEEWPNAKSTEEEN